MLYGLGALSLLMLLFEVVAGDNPPTQVDLASRPATTRATAPPAPTSSTSSHVDLVHLSSVPPTTVSPATPHDAADDDDPQAFADDDRGGGGDHDDHRRGDHVDDRPTSPLTTYRRHVPEP